MGDDRARQRLTELWVSHADTVRRFARRRVHEAEVEDVVAETFAVAWRRIEQVPDHALPWLYAVARNVIGTRMRSQDRSDALMAKVAGQPVTDTQSAEADALERVHLVQAWSQLTEAEREVIALVAWEGLTSSEAATVLQCLPSTFAVRLLRARRRLAHLLERGAAVPQARGRQGGQPPRGADSAGPDDDGPPQRDRPTADRPVVDQPVVERPGAEADGSPGTSVQRGKGNG